MKKKISYEDDCYEQILNLYERYIELNDKKEKVRQICLSIIKIMDVFRQYRDKNVLANSLIMIIELFFDIPPDVYNNRGIDVKWMAKADKQKRISKILEVEVLL